MMRSLNINFFTLNKIFIMKKLFLIAMLCLSMGACSTARGQEATEELEVSQVAVPLPPTVVELRMYAPLEHGAYCLTAIATQGELLQNYCAAQPSTSVSPAKAATCAPLRTPYWTTLHKRAGR
jgi:hypothetical protein